MSALAMSRKQLATIAAANSRVNLWEGSVRSGKTICSIFRWLAYVADPPPGGQLVMVGRTRDSLSRNVIDPLMDDSIFGEISEHVSYTNGANFAMILGRRVHMLGASDAKAEKSLRGLTVAGAYVDEATVIRQDFFNQLLARMSVPGAKMFATTNPDSPSHWLKADYLDRIDQLPDWVSFHFQLDDNPRLDEEYKDSLKREYSGLWYRRFILGEWVAADGAVFDFWDPDEHVIKWEDLPRMSEFVAVGLDYGITNPTAAILLGLGVDGKLYAVDEWRRDSTDKEMRWTDVELSRGIKAWLPAPHLPPSRFDQVEPPPPMASIYLDPSAASMSVQMRQDDMYTYSADNDVSYGIRVMSAMLSRGILKVSTHCPGLLREMPGYSWDSKATEGGYDRPVKVADHSIDALRYALISTETYWRSTVDAYTPNAA